MRLSRVFLIGTLLISLSAHGEPRTIVAEASNVARAAPQGRMWETSTGRGLMEARQVAVHTRRIERKTISPRALLPVVDQRDIRPEHRAIADEVLRMLPPQCEGALKNFYVRYDNPKERGLASKSSVIMSGNVPPDEFRALLFHEVFGHVVDLGCLRGNLRAGASAFRDGDEVVWNDDPSVFFYRLSWMSARERRNDSNGDDFVSGYASRGDAFEDLAETAVYYALHRESFRRRARNNAVLASKLRWMGTFLPLPESLASDPLPVEPSNDIAWDATKLPYVWNGRAEVAVVR